MRARWEGVSFGQLAATKHETKRRAPTPALSAAGGIRNRETRVLVDRSFAMEQS